MLLSFSDVFNGFRNFLVLIPYDSDAVVVGCWAVHCLNRKSPKLEIRVNSIHLRADTLKFSPVDIFV